MRTLLVVCLAGAVFAQSSISPRRRTEEIGTNGKQSVSQNDPPKPPGTSLHTASPPEMQSETKTREGGRQTESPWRKYLSEAFAPVYLSNWILALFGMVAAVIALKTLSAIKEQARIARVGLAATRVAANAARSSATAARDSNSLTQDSNNVTRRATDLTQQSIVLTHRPKITVSNVFVHGEFCEGSTANGKLSIINKGGMPAHITEIYATVKVYGRLPMKTLQDDGVSGDQTPRSLSPGQRITFQFKKEDGALAAGEIPALNGSGREDSRRLYVLGFIKYTDDLNPPIARQTSFCRMLDPSLRRFQPVEDADYECID